MSTEIVKFGNPGLIDPRVWSTFGISAKESDSPIGQFGTGLKYAIAVMMREGRVLEIKSGDQMYVFESKTVEFRGKEFGQIYCNDKELPFTTELGKNWSIENAYRELASNCMDEGGSVGNEGETTVYAQIADVRHSSIFLNTDQRRLIEQNELCEIYAGESRCIYYKGIRAYDIPNGCKSLFTINLKVADLTEDRTLKYYAYDTGKAVTDAVLLSKSSEFIRKFLTQTKEYLESQLSVFSSGLTPTKEFVESYDQYRRESVWLHPALSNEGDSHVAKKEIIAREPTDLEFMVIKKAIDFCAKIGMPIKYPVIVSDDIGKSTLGLADRDGQNIYLSGRCLTMGVKQVASTLIEENIHIAHGLDDCNYEMQSFLFDQIVTMGERLIQEVI